MRSDDRSSEPLLKGQLFVVRLEYLQRMHGTQGLRQTLECLPRVERERLRSLERNAWYPFRTLVQLDRAIAAVTAPDDPSIYERLGEASSHYRTEWLGRHAPLVSVHGFLARSAEEHRRFHNFGRASYRRTAFTEGEMSLSDYPEVDEVFCRSATGYFRGVLQALTNAPAVVEEHRCQCRGDDACLFRLSRVGPDASRAVEPPSPRR